MSKRKRDEGLQQFRRSVQDLNTKSQSKISNIKNLAESQIDTAEETVRILVDEIGNAGMERLQPLLMLVDCILKRVGKEYKTEFSKTVLGMFRRAYDQANPQMRTWLQRMLNDSWRKYELLPDDVLDSLNAIFVDAPSTAVKRQDPATPSRSLAQAVPVATKIELESPAPRRSQLETPPARAFVPIPSKQQTEVSVDAAQSAAQAVTWTSTALPQHGTTWSQPTAVPVKAPPHQNEAKKELSEEKRGLQSNLQVTEDSLAEHRLVVRRLGILTKIMERQAPRHDELKEIMEVPAVKAAIEMQQNGQRHEAMSLLSKFKHDLEERHGRTDPRLRAEGERAEYRSETEPKPADPRQLDPRSRDVRPSDPRQEARLQAPPIEKAETKRRDPRRNDATSDSAKRPAEVASVDPRKHQRSANEGEKLSETQASAPLGTVADEGIPLEIVSDDEQDNRTAEEKAFHEGQVAQVTQQIEIAQERQILRGMPSIGFSESWLRQFMEQLPTRSLQRDAPGAPAGRKVLSASGEQMVYVDEMSPSEVMLLMQFIFLMEQRLRRSGGGIDLAQRIPHTFSYLQVEPAIDVMLKRFFDELPHQCSTTGLRFATREKFRRHHDALFRRRSLAQQRLRGAEARGWMESIPEWVGNRDLVVGPALFRLGGAGDDVAPKSQETRRSHLPEDADPDGEDERLLWMCPADDRRSVCPISGEPFERTWSKAHNDWVYVDVAAVEMDSDTTLNFVSADGEEEPDLLTETAVLVKRSCFINTTSAKRLEALEDCRASVQLEGLDEVGPQIKPREDRELDALAKQRKAQPNSWSLCASRPRF